MAALSPLEYACLLPACCSPSTQTGVFRCARPSGVPGGPEKPRCLKLKGPSAAVNSPKHVNKPESPSTKQQIRPGPSPTAQPFYHLQLQSFGATGWVPPPLEPGPLPLWCSFCVKAAQPTHGPGEHHWAFQTLAAFRGSSEINCLSLILALEDELLTHCQGL